MSRIYDMWSQAPYSTILGRVPSPGDWYHLMLATEMAGQETGRSTQHVRQEIKLARYDAALKNLRHLLAADDPRGPEVVEASRAQQAHERQASWRRWVALTGIRIKRALATSRAVDEDRS